MLEGYDELLGTQISVGGVNGVLVSFVKGVSYKVKLLNAKEIVIPVADAIQAKRIALDGTQIEFGDGAQCKLSCFDEPQVNYSELGSVNVTWLHSNANEKLPLIDILRLDRDQYVGLQYYKKYDSDEMFLLTVTNAIVRHGEKYYKLMFEDGDFEYISKFELLQELTIPAPSEKIVRIEDIPSFTAASLKLVGDATSVIKSNGVTNVRFWGKSIYVALGQNGEYVVVNDLLDTENGLPGEAKATKAIHKADILVAINGVSIVGDYVESVARKINSLPRPIMLSFAKPQSTLVSEDASVGMLSKNTTRAKSSENSLRIYVPIIPSNQLDSNKQQSREIERNAHHENHEEKIPSKTSPPAMPEVPQTATPKNTSPTTINAPGQSLLSKSTTNKAKAPVAKSTVKRTAAAHLKDQESPSSPENDPKPPKIVKEVVSNAAPGKEDADLDGISSDSDSDRLTIMTANRKRKETQAKLTSTVPTKKHVTSRTKALNKENIDDDPSAKVQKPTSDQVPAKVPKSKKRRPVASPAKVPLEMEHSFLRPTSQPSKKPSKAPKTAKKKSPEDIVEKRNGRNKRIHIQVDTNSLQLSLHNPEKNSFPMVLGFLRGSDDNPKGQIELDGRVRVGAQLLSANGISFKGMTSIEISSFLKQAPRPLALSFLNSEL